MKIGILVHPFTTNVGVNDIANVYIEQIKNADKTIVLTSQTGDELHNLYFKELRLPIINYVCTGEDTCINIDVNTIKMSELINRVVAYETIKTIQSISDFDESTIDNVESSKLDIRTYFYKHYDAIMSVLTSIDIDFFKGDFKIGEVTRMFDRWRTINNVELIKAGNHITTKVLIKAIAENSQLFKQDDLTVEVYGECSDKLVSDINQILLDLGLPSSINHGTSLDFTTVVMSNHKSLVRKTQGRVMYITTSDIKEIINESRVRDDLFYDRFNYFSYMKNKVYDTFIGLHKRDNHFFKLDAQVVSRKPNNTPIPGRCY